jgi:hypothetical protein
MGPADNTRIVNLAAVLANALGVDLINCPGRRRARVVF